MLNQTIRRKIAFVVFAVATFGLVGCAGLPQSGKPEEVVKVRAQERVKLLQAKDFTKAYEYLAPSYRALNSVETYRNSFGGGASWVNPTVEKVECPDADRCIAEVKLGVLVVARGFGSQPLPTVLRETWILQDGNWWFFKNN